MEIKKLYENWKIEFEFENKTYIIKLEEIINETAIISISDGQTFNLAVNETKKLGLNDDGFYDLEIFLNNVAYKKADLIVKFIYEEIPVEEFEKIEKKVKIRDVINKFIEMIKSYWLLILIGVSCVIVVIVGIIVVLRIVKKNKKKYLGDYVK